MIKNNFMENQKKKKGKSDILGRKI